MFKTSPPALRSVPWIAFLCAALFSFGSPKAFAVVQLDATSTQLATQGAMSMSCNRMIVCGITLGYNDTASLRSPPRLRLRTLP